MLGGRLWPRSDAGLALMPGPTMAAIFAAPAGRLGARIGQPPVIAAGGLIFAAGFAINLALVGSTPDYAGSFLPGFLLGGVGVGLVLGTGVAAGLLALAIGSPEQECEEAVIEGLAPQEGAA